MTPRIALSAFLALSVAVPPAFAFSDNEAAALAAMGFQKQGADYVDEACSQPVQAQFSSVDIGGEFGEVMQVIAGGPCFGAAGAMTALVDFVDGKPNVVFSDLCYGVTVLAEANAGVHDIQLGVPGFEYPVMRWGGQAYVFSRTVKDPNAP